MGNQTVTRRIWKDTIENGRLFAELSGTRVQARVLTVPITYGRGKHQRSGYPYCYGARGGVVSTFNEAKWQVEQMAEHFEARR
jgi:hypothetical protein